MGKKKTLPSLATINCLQILREMWDLVESLSSTIICLKILRKRGWPQVTFFSLSTSLPPCALRLGKSDIEVSLTAKYSTVLYSYHHEQARVSHHCKMEFLWPVLMGSTTKNKQQNLVKNEDHLRLRGHQWKWENKTV